jgi:hypothetical protein
VVARGGVEPPTFRFSVGRSYQLSYLAWRNRLGEQPVAKARSKLRASRPRPGSNRRPSP